MPHSSTHAGCARQLHTADVAANLACRQGQPRTPGTVAVGLLPMASKGGQPQRDAEADPIEPKAHDEIGSGALQSLDDLEATFRYKAGESYQGYVANISESCDDENDVQLILKVQVAPNNTDTAILAATSLSRSIFMLQLLMCTLCSGVMELSISYSLEFSTPQRTSLVNQARCANSASTRPG